ncbi:MAG: pyrroline-5-carboxylate reductase [Clostridia bacterium]|nr:pyrroline-5-carboxylate reductase [Clostridia bacterium]
MKKIAFIGAGNMASAICGGIINAKIASAQDIILFDKNEAQYSKFDSLCNKATSLNDAVSFADCIFFSVKPQNMKEILGEVSKFNLEDKLFISICAGVTIASIEETLGNVKIVRTMPNTPLLIGQGVTALCKNDAVTDEEFAFASSLFASSGYTFEAKEDDINRITAITSSAPAYVYLFAKAMLVGAESIGFEGENTIEMICRTLIGSANMILNDERSVDELIRMVKSPNGTTEKALNVFEEKKFIEIVSEAMKACTDRANELSKLN